MCDRSTQQLKSIANLRPQPIRNRQCCMYPTTARPAPQTNVRMNPQRTCVHPHPMQHATPAKHTQAHAPANTGFLQTSKSAFAAPAPGPPQRSPCIRNLAPTTADARA